MEVAIVVIVIGALTGLAAGVVVAMSSAPDLDEPHLRPGTMRRLVTERPLARWVGRAVPRHRGAALAEGLVLAGVIVVVAAAAIGVTLLMIRTNTGVARADPPLADLAAEHATPRSTTIMRELSKFGGTEYVLIAAVAVAAHGWLRDRRWAILLFVLTTMIGQFLVSNAIKWSVDRARPTLSNLTGFSGTSFPSGHAMAAAAAWVSVAFLLGRGRSSTVRGLLFGVAVGLGVAVAGTRVALGVHWTTDVIVGLVIGWSWFALCSVLFGGHRLQPAAPIVEAHIATSATPR